jgi:hypothetical protein
MGGIKRRKAKKRLDARIKSFIALGLASLGGYTMPGSNKR